MRNKFVILYKWNRIIYKLLRVDSCTIHRSNYWAARLWSALVCGDDDAMREIFPPKKITFHFIYVYGMRAVIYRTGHEKYLCNNNDDGLDAAASALIPPSPITSKMTPPTFFSQTTPPTTHNMRVSSNLMCLNFLKMTIKLIYRDFYFAVIMLSRRTNNRNNIYRERKNQCTKKFFFLNKIKKNKKKKKKLAFEFCWLDSLLELMASVVYVNIGEKIAAVVAPPAPVSAASVSFFFLFFCLFVADVIDR